MSDIYKPPTNEEWEDMVRQRHAYACVQLRKAVRKNDQDYIARWDTYLANIEALIDMDNFPKLFD